MEFEEFKEWLLSFELYRGKKTGDDSEDESRIVGLFKVTLRAKTSSTPFTCLASREQ